MAQTFNLDVLRRMTADIRRIYQALVRAQAFVGESGQIRQTADELLYQAGLLYLTG